MKRTTVLFMAAALILAGAGISFAAEEGTMGMAAQAEAPAKPNVGNKICPISGKEIAKMGDGKGMQIEYNGKIYNLCCGMCTKDFNADPAKYSKIAETEVAAGAAAPAAAAVAGDAMGDMMDHNKAMDDMMGQGKEAVGGMKDSAEEATGGMMDMGDKAMDDMKAGAEDTMKK